MFCLHSQILIDQAQRAICKNLSSYVKRCAPLFYATFTLLSKFIFSLFCVQRGHFCSRYMTCLFCFYLWQFFRLSVTCSDIKTVKETRKCFDKISDDFDLTLTRNSQVPRSKPAECEDYKNTVMAVRSCFQHTGLDYIYQVSFLFLSTLQFVFTITDQIRFSFFILFRFFVKLSLVVQFTLRA